MNPPRPTPAKMRSLVKKYERIIDDINLMCRGNVKSSDTRKLDCLRAVRTEAVQSVDALRVLAGDSDV